MEKMRNDIFVYRQVTPVNLAGKRKRIQVFYGRTILCAEHRPVPHKTDAVDLFPRSPLGQFLDRVVEFAATDHVDRSPGNLQRLPGKYRDVGTGKHGDG